jgi:hypothetical protein
MCVTAGEVMGNRGGDDGPMYFNSNRFFNEDAKWYFTTRENSLFGPFDTRADAEQELMVYPRSLRERKKFGLKPGQ